MIYSKRFGGFMTVVSVATTLFVTYLAKPFIEQQFPEHKALWTIAAGLLLLVAIYCIIYASNLILIRLTPRSGLAHKLEKRWRDLLSANGYKETPIEDYVDRVADLQLRVSMPSVVSKAAAGILSDQKATIEALQQNIAHYAGNNNLRATISLLGTHWKTPRAVTSGSSWLVDDPVHGCVTLDDDLSAIIAQPIVQRLSRIRQLSFSFTHFPSATHSRLSHVLGVANNVEVALNGIFSRGVYYVEGAEKPATLPDEILGQRDLITRRGKLLAVLHDLGHGPFGHALDNYVGYVNGHDNIANPDKVYSRLYVKKYLSTALTQLGFDPENLIRVLDPTERHLLQGFDSLVGDLIDSSIDMDRMDYLIRDAHMTGLSMGFTNADALIQCIRPVKVDDSSYILAYDETGLDHMEHLLYAREAMYRSCYEHPRKRASERILERLIKEVAADDPEIIDDLFLLTDEELICALRFVDLKSEIARNLLDQLVASSDYAVVHEVQADSKEISEDAQVWVKGAAAGKGKQSYVDRPAEFEDAIARESIGAERAYQILVIVAPPSAYQQKFDAAEILYKDEEGMYRTKNFFEVKSRVKNVLSAMNPARSRIKVMCAANLNNSDRAKIKQSCVSQLGK